MAYRYNAKTGEFENAPEMRPQRTTAAPVQRPATSTSSSTSSSALGGCLGAILYGALQFLPYLVIGVLCSMCS